MHLTTGQRIEDVNCVLQVDFANKYIVSNTDQLFLYSKSMLLK
jgi:hypothetical protein